MRSVMRRAWAASTEGVAPGMPRSRWSCQGSSGLGAVRAGHAWSLARRNQMASKLEPADSSGPMICAGAWRDSGANRVSAAIRASAARASVKRTRTPAKSRVASSSSVLSHLRRVWNSTLSSKAGGAQPAASEQLADGCNPVGVGALGGQIEPADECTERAQMVEEDWKTAVGI